MKQAIHANTAGRFASLFGQLLSKRPEMFAPDQWPGYYREAHGCEVVDLDGRRYVDMSYMGIGACLLGYNDPDVTDAVVARVKNGSMCTLNSPEEVELAQLLLAIHPWAAKVRFARTGGEAMAIAVRIARARTGRDVVAFCGYHGWHDWYLAANRTAQSGGDALAKTSLAGPVAQRRADATGRHGLAFQLQPNRFVGRDRQSARGPPGGRRDGAHPALRSGARFSWRVCGSCAIGRAPCWCSTRSALAGD